MVFYFSATGNSKYAAQRIGSEFGGQIINISDAMRNNEYEYQVKDEEKVFFVFPVYFFGLPNLVHAFLKEVQFAGGVPNVCGIATCGSTAGGCDLMFKKALKGKEVHVRAFYQIKMVENYVLMYKIPRKEEQLMILRRADKELSSCIDAIRFNFRTSYQSSLGMRLAGKAVYSLYKGKGRCGTKKFFANDGCIGCGLCQTICPVNAIQMEEGRPVWVKEQCVHCLGCLHRCPAASIQYGKKTESRGRYINPALK